MPARPSTDLTVWAPDGMGVGEIELFKRTLAKGATDDELALLLRTASHYQLDPLTKEIWYARFEGNEKPGTIMVGRDGLLAIAERSGQFDGMTSGVVKAGDTFVFGQSAPEHTFGAEHAVQNAKGEETYAVGRGPISFAYAYVYRKDRSKPFRVIAEWLEHGKPKTRDAQGNLLTGGQAKTPWMKFPSSMIRKVAEAQALNLAFRVSGAVGDAEVAEAVDDSDVIDVEVLPDEPEAPTVEPEEVRLDGENAEQETLV